MNIESALTIVIVVALLCITYTTNNSNNFKEELKLDRCQMGNGWSSDLDKNIRQKAAEYCLEKP